MNRYEVRPYSMYQHPDGRTASVFGAYPGPGFEIVIVGYTLYNTRTNTYGAYSLPRKATLEQAQALADRLNAQ